MLSKEIDKEKSTGLAQVAVAVIKLPPEKVRKSQIQTRPVNHQRQKLYEVNLLRFNIYFPPVKFLRRRYSIGSAHLHQSEKA